MYDITKTIIKSLSCAIFMDDIIYISYDFAYDICNLWFRVWSHVWWGTLISVTWDIIALWCHRFLDITPYIMEPARQPGKLYRPALKFQVPSYWHLANWNTHHIYCLAGIQVLLVAAVGSQLRTSLPTRSLRLTVRPSVESAGQTRNHWPWDLLLVMSHRSKQ